MESFEIVFEAKDSKTVAITDGPDIQFGSATTALGLVVARNNNRLEARVTSYPIDG